MDIDSIVGIKAAPGDEGWFVTVRGLYVNVEHKTCVLGFDSDQTLSNRLRPTRFENKLDAMKAAATFKDSLRGPDAALPVRVVHRQRIMHETEYDIVSGRRLE